MSKKIYQEAASAKEKKLFEKFLSEDEELVIATGYGATFMRHQYIYNILWPGGIGFLVGLAYAYFQELNIGYGLLGGMVLSFIIAYFRNMHIYNSHRYLLTTRRVILKKGVFSVRLITALYDKITHIEVEQSLYDRLVMHHGTVIINTAGGNNDSLKIENIDAPIEFKNLLERLINREREQYGRGGGPVVTLEGEVVDE